jgi:hypothetical protein
MKCISLLSLALSTSALAASASPGNDILGELSRCDRGFFEALQQRSAELTSNKQFVKAPTFGYFKVPDRGDPERSVLTFAAPLNISRIELVAYFDQLFPLVEKDMFIAWGFLLKAPIADVIKSAQSSIWDSQRLQPDGGMYTRTEILDLAQPDIGWQKVVTPGDAELQPGTVERVLVIEPYDKDPALTRFACSLRGPVTPEVLKTMRPDVNTKALSAR